MFKRRHSNNSDSPRQEMNVEILDGSLGSPGISRYGRSHKLKLQDDFVSTDKKVSAYLKLSPGSQIQFVREQQRREPKKRNSPKKSPPVDSPRRGRPPKMISKPEEDVTKIVMKAEPQNPTERVEGCEWMVGDLAWGRVGQHPFWPCMVALDPVHKIFTKLIKKGRATTYAQRFIHVQFFGDNGRRSWLNVTAVMVFSGRDAFLQLGETILAGMRRKEPKQTSAFSIKPAVIQVWEKAVQEAEDLINATREARVEFFTINFPPPPPLELTKKQILEKLDTVDSDYSPPKQRGRKRKADQTPTEDESKVKQMKLEVKPEKMEPEAVDLLSTTPRTIADRKKRQALLIQLARSGQSPPEPTSSSTNTEKPQSDDAPSQAETPKQAQLKRSSVNEVSDSVSDKKPKRKYVKKKLPVDFQAFSSKHFDQVADDHQELNEKEVNKYLLKMWNEMDDTQKARYKVRLAAAEKEGSDSEPSSEVALSSEEAENDDRPSSKSSSPPPLATPTQKPTAKRSNFTNLFYGAKAEKVCQICEKAGETVRCRGPCQSFYHPQCVTEPPAPAATAVKRGRPKKSINSESTSSSSSDVSESLSSQETCDVFKKELQEKVEVEVVEPEKSNGKARKGSKDSETSSEEGEGFRCKDCQVGRSQTCFVCDEHVHKTSGEAKLYRCNIAYCGKLYHEECLKLWPQCSWRTNGNGKGTDRAVLTCPQHTCHTCASDNPGVIKARYNNDKLVRCVRCPTTYHHGNHCLPAGSEILTNSQIVCPRHYQPPKKSMLHHVNAAWCFICASGGSLICCDLCPTAFHADCLNISTPPDGSYVCEDCQTGRFPLYGEIVWVKLGAYRWWPAQILYPALIPDNILKLPHVHGEFAVKFFGSRDHYWINRGRVFLYQDGDSGKVGYKKSSVDHTYERAIKEASEAQRKCMEEKATRDAEVRPGMKPPLYVKLKTNKPVGSVRTVEMNLSSLTPCECDPKSDNPCAPDSDCLNRILLVECNPHVCPAGEKCRNQMFEKRLYPPLMPYHTQGRGWGLKTLVPLKKGDFVIEYVGEMIDEEEYKRRLTHMHENNEENFYFLTIDKDRLLDAGPKGNVARFMNHSCQPNCETQKWTVNGDTRVGLFALDDIPAETELVFNYNLESIGSDKKPCMCGAPNCSGFIGVKASKNVEKEEGKEKRVMKKKKSLVVMKAHEEECFVCGEGGELVLCDGKHCVKGYHLSCLNRKQGPQGYWLCPWHQCNVCHKGRVQRCSFCVNSYCQEHAKGNIRLDAERGLVCSKHDQAQDSITTNKPVEHSDSSEKDKSSKPETIPMEVDSDSSSKSSSQPSEEIATNKETSDNIQNSTKSAQRRTRRSKSNADELVNGLAAKVNKRKSRPSSVDENLISSSINSNKTGELVSKPELKEVKEEVNDTLQGNGTNSPESTCVESKVRVSEITSQTGLKDVSDENVEHSTGTQDTLKPDVKENTRDNLDETTEQMDVDEEELSSAKDTNNEYKVEETPDAHKPSESTETSTSISKAESTKQNNNFTETAKSSEIINKLIEPSEVDEDLGNSSKTMAELVKPSETLEEPVEQTENVDEPTKSSEIIVEETNKLKEITKEPVKPSKNLEERKALELNESLVNPEETINAKTNQDMEPKTELETKQNCEIELAANRRAFQTEENLNKTDELTVDEESILEMEKEAPEKQKNEEGLDNPNECLEEDKSIDDSKSLEISPELSINEKEEAANKLNDSKDLDSGKKSAENLLSDKMCNGKSEELLDEGKSTLVSDDDFELTFSECSNDKITNNPESSINLKVTDCTNSETLSENLDESKDKSDLVNGIDQSSTMEVA